MNSKILDMINRYVEEADFFGEITEESIVHAEKELGIAFPIAYRAFVHKFGFGGICGVDILGVGTNGYASVVNSTNRFRKLGLSHQYIVIENVDEFIYCLNTKGNNQVIRWDRISKEAVDRYTSFDAFLEDSFQEAIDNWD